jgi:hypothetical protein
VSSAPIVYCVRQPHSIDKSLHPATVQPPDLSPGPLRKQAETNALLRAAARQSGKTLKAPRVDREALRSEWIPVLSHPPLTALSITNGDADLCIRMRRWTRSHRHDRTLRAAPGHSHCTDRGPHRHVSPHAGRNALCRDGCGGWALLFQVARALVTFDGDLGLGATSIRIFSLSSRDSYPGADRVGQIRGGKPPLQFALQFTCVQHRPRRYTPSRDLHRWTPLDVRKRRAADS